MEKLLVRAISAGHVTELEPINLAPNALHLRLRYRFKAQVGDRIQLGAFPVSPGVTYARSLVANRPS